MTKPMKNEFFAKSISDWYLQPDHADIHFTFKTDDQVAEVPAHKYILAIASPVFLKMFFGPLKGKDVVEIIHVSENAFKEFLQFFYRSEVQLSMENIESVARLTHEYEMLDCLDICAEFLMDQLDADDIIWGYQLAILLNNQKLKEFCEEEIAMFASNALKTDAFLNCSREVVKNILQMERLISTEVEIFEACIQWAKSSCQANGLDENDSQNLKQQLGDCFYLIQFNKMQNKEMGSIMANESYRRLFTCDELKDLLCAKLDEDNKYAHNIFKVVTRLDPTRKWDINREMDCRLTFASGSRANIQSRESTWFSTNVPILLGGNITCDDIREKRCYVKISFTIQIFEHKEETFAQNVRTSELFTGEISSGSSASLENPIIIRPTRMYEIRLQTTSNVDYRYHYHSIGKCQVELNEHVTIKFHQHPENNGDRFGLISRLQFNSFA